MKTAQYRFSTRLPLDSLTTVDTRVASGSGRGLAFALLITAWIAAVDLFWAYTNMSILYAVPLTVLAMTGGRKQLWRFTGLLVALTYAIYLLKYAINTPDDVAQVYLNFRLVNRTLVAASLLGIAYVFGMWFRWTTDQSDPELSSNVQFQERELSATVAMLCCIPIVLIIAGIDFIAPATYNLAILYPIPLFICVWIQSRQLLWVILAVLLALSAMAHFWGVPPHEDVSEAVLLRSRMIAAAGLVILTTLLSSWVTPTIADAR